MQPEIVLVFWIFQLVHSAINGALTLIINITRGAAIILHGPAIILRGMTSIWSIVHDICISNTKKMIITF